MEQNTTLGVIGGTGLYEMEGLSGVGAVEVEPPFGAPSAPFVTGTLAGVDMVFLPRHGRGHRLLPSEVNNRANIFGMKKLGVGRILSVSAVGSLQAEIEPGHVVLPDQFIDRTYRRPSTFFGDGIVAHVQFADPFCNDLRAAVAASAADEDITVHGRGTYVCMEGPQFSTRAESALHRSWGADVIGMTNLQEAKLAREAEICFATIAMATDYDCWNEAAGDVDIEEVIAVLQKNADVAKRIVRGTLERLTAERACPCATALAMAIVTDRSVIPDEARTRLGPLVDKYL
ncbi:MAG: S-methyl-5'-thioadenosine phosphorylase [Deltaproteobacteria bacterium]|nr:S-methyl-5'-thioadenosine phosphorylase [Deltaproteobacteria bacterium]